MVLSLILVHILLLLFYYKFIPDKIKKYLFYIIILIFIIILLFINEIYNCDKMLKWKKLPYHSIIEFIGFFIFYNYTEFFIELSKF